MKRAILAGLMALTLLASGCTTQTNTYTVGGRVVNDTVKVGAPALPVPVAIVASGVDTATPGSGPRGSMVATMTGMGTRVRVQSIDVAVGDRVKPGQVVAVLDGSALAAGVDAARAQVALSKAMVRVIDQRLSDVASARATIADARATVLSALDTIGATRQQIEAKLAQAKALLPQLEAKLAELKKQRDQLQATLAQLVQLKAKLEKIPPGVPLPPGTPTLAQVNANIAKINAALGQIDAGIAKLEAAIAQLNAGIPQLEAALGKLSAGEAKAQAGLQKLADAKAKTADAKSALNDARDLSAIGVDISRIGVDIAKLQLSLAQLTSPVSGTVVRTAQAGEVLTPGAPVVEIRPTAASEVEVWLAPEKAARISVGDDATVSLESRPGQTYAAKVSEIAPRATYPPTYVATQDVHLTRAIKIRVRLEDSSIKLPAGTPADVTIHAGSKQ